MTLFSLVKAENKMARSRVRSFLLDVGLGHVLLFGTADQKSLLTTPVE